jgi:hypothetical protein
MPFTQLMAKQFGGNVMLARSDGGDFEVLPGVGGGGSGVGILIVPNIAAMKALDTTEFEEGQLVYTQTDGAYWTFYEGAVDVDVPSALENSDDGFGVYSRNVSGRQSLDVYDAATWVVNALTGDDENSGHDGDNPLKTVAEIARRYGTNSPVLRRNVTVQLDGDLPITDPWTLTPTGNSATAKMTVIGTLTSVATTTIGTFTPLDRDAANQNVISASGGPAGFWAPFVGRLVHDTTADAWFWVNNNLGSARAQIGTPCTQATPGAGGPPAPVVIANGDALDVLQPSVLYMDYADLGGALAGTGVIFQTLELRAAGTAGALGTCSFDRCTFTDFFEFVRNPLSSIFYNCDVGPSGGMLLASSQFFMGQARGSIAVDWGSAGAMLFDGDFLFLESGQFTGVITLGQVGFFSAPFNATNPVEWHVVEVNFGTAVMWGDNGETAFDVKGGSRITASASAALALKVTGGYTLDGQGQAFPWDDTTHAFQPIAAITIGNLDAAGGLQRPFSGSRILVSQA